MRNIKDKIEQLLINEGLLIPYKADNYYFEMSFDSSNDEVRLNIDYKDTIDVDDID